MSELRCRITPPPRFAWSPSPSRGEDDYRRFASLRPSACAIFPQGGPEPLEDVDEADLVHRPRVAEALEAFPAVIGADAARADAAEREMLLGDVEQGAVESHSARNRAVEHPLAVAAAGC